MERWLDLWDYRRRVHDSYRQVRDTRDPEEAWHRWRADRDELFATHPQSPLEPEARSSFRGLPYFDYDPGWRLVGTVRPLEADPEELGHSASGSTRFLRFGTVDLDTPTGSVQLSLYWLDTYGGGVFLPFRDGTAGTSTYGGGRYLLDTAKGADLGHDGDQVVLDFNFAYHPSCVHSPRWSCPLAPRHNRITIPIEAGERLAAPPS